MKSKDLFEEAVELLKKYDDEFEPREVEEDM